MTTMRVLGVDPGLTRCGIGVVDALGGRRARLVHAGVLRSGSEDPLDRRLLAIARGLRAVLEDFAPDAVAVERVFSQNNISTVMGTAQVSGIALLEAAERGIPTALHTPSEVKAAVTGSGRADKKQIQTMLIRLLGLDAAPQPADASDAVAIALTSCGADRARWRWTPPAAHAPAPRPSGPGPSARRDAPGSAPPPATDRTGVLGWPGDRIPDRPCRPHRPRRPRARGRRHRLSRPHHAAGAQRDPSRRRAHPPHRTGRPRGLVDPLRVPARRGGRDLPHRPVGLRH